MRIQKIVTCFMTATMVAYITELVQNTKIGVESMVIVIGTIMLIVVLTLDHQDQMTSFALKHKEYLKTPKIVPNTTAAVTFMQLVIFVTQVSYILILQIPMCFWYFTM